MVPAGSGCCSATPRRCSRSSPTSARSATLDIGVVGPHPEGSGCAVEVRAFCPGMGIVEDPVTGSLNAGLAPVAGRQPPAVVVRRGSRYGARPGRPRPHRDPGRHGLGRWRRDDHDQGHGRSGVLASNRARDTRRPRPAADPPRRLPRARHGAPARHHPRRPHPERGPGRCPADRHEGHLGGHRHRLGGAADQRHGRPLPARHLDLLHQPHGRQGAPPRRASRRVGRPRGRRGDGGLLPRSRRRAGRRRARDRRPALDRPLRLVAALLGRRGDVPPRPHLDGRLRLRSATSCSSSAASPPDPRRPAGTTSTASGLRRT